MIPTGIHGSISKIHESRAISSGGGRGGEGGGSIEGWKIAKNHIDGRALCRGRILFIFPPMKRL